MSNIEEVKVVLRFRNESTRSDRDSDVAYLDEFFQRLLNEVSAFESYRIVHAPADAGSAP